MTLALLLFSATALHAAEPASLDAVVRQAIADCAPAVELRSVDCSSTPCVALFDDPGTDWRKLKACPVWGAAFGADSTVSTMGGFAECADGTKRPFFIMAPDPHGGSAFGRVTQARDWFPCKPDAHQSEPKAETPTAG